jgi:hypothetical protein
MKLHVFCDVLPLAKESYWWCNIIMLVCLLWQWHEYTKVSEGKETVTLITADVLAARLPTRTHTCT